MAANYLVMYTLMFSFPLLVLVIRFLVDCSVVGWTSVVWVDRVVMIVILLPFVIKLPIYLFHFWLPKAHVEAPVLGRMILASILLKTGGYGLVKVSGLSVGSGCVFGLVGLLLFLSLMSAVTTVVQNDLKKFVAYSSVTHMTMVLGLVVMGFEVLDSAVVCLMLSHGVLSNSMFFLVGMFSNSSKTRLLFKQQGLLQLSPVVWFFLVFLLFMSSRVPPSIGMVGEGAINLVRLIVLTRMVVVITWLVLAAGYWWLWWVSRFGFCDWGERAWGFLVVTLGCGLVFNYEYVVYGPLSSLVHSSTLVVAGCVLCVKLGDCIRVVWVNGLLIVLEDFGLFDYVADCDGNVNIVEWYILVDDDAYYESCIGEGLIVYECWYSDEEYSVCLSVKEDTLFHLMNVVLFMSVIYSLRMVYVLMGGLSVMVVPVLVMGWFLIMNFSMPCNPCFDVFKAFLLVTPFVMMLFVLKVFVLGFVKSMHVSGVMSLVSLVSFNVGLKMEKHGFEEPGIFEGE
ncbi:NADH-ubiquinone oxidoreductase chain 4 [Trichinella sp. T9]|nr:NADH-ubiquinone oxidoreductase chain 4 [Trichinella sp. T9]